MHKQTFAQKFSMLNVMGETLPEHIQQDILPLHYDMQQIRITRACARCGARMERVIPRKMQLKLNMMPEFLAFRKEHRDCTREIPELPQVLQDFVTDMLNLTNSMLKDENLHDVPPMWAVSSMSPEGEHYIQVLPNPGEFGETADRRRHMSRAMALSIQATRNLDVLSVSPPELEFAGFLCSAWQVIQQREEGQGPDLSVLPSESPDREETIMVQIATTTQAWYITFNVTRVVPKDDTTLGACTLGPIWPIGTCPALDGLLVMMDDYVSPLEYKPYS